MIDYAKKTMRDVLIEEIDRRMAHDASIYFLTADLGAPALDGMRARYAGRCLNVGIAEQNAVAVATGLALEGCAVFVYGIAPFITMRAYEQIRINLALLSQTRALNVNVIGLGAGFSYDASGPTHHCLEDIALMRLLPNMEVFSPSDSFAAGSFIEHALARRCPKYLRLDGRPQGRIYLSAQQVDLAAGFAQLRAGDRLCLAATGHMTQKALEIAEKLEGDGISTGVIDLFMLKAPDEKRLAAELRAYRHLFSLEEGFLDRGGLDTLLSGVVRRNALPVSLHSFGAPQSYLFDNGGRERLHRACGMDEATVIEAARRLC